MASRTGSCRGADAWKARVGGRTPDALGEAWLRASNWPAGRRNSLADMVGDAVLFLKLRAWSWSRIFAAGKRARASGFKGPLQRRVIPPVVFVSSAKLRCPYSLHAAYCFFLLLQYSSHSCSAWLFSSFFSPCSFPRLFRRCSSSALYAFSERKWDSTSAGRRVPDENCCWPGSRQSLKTLKPSTTSPRTTTGKRLHLWLQMAR